MADKLKGPLRCEIRPPGTDYVMSTDDFTLDEVESLEAQTEVPWLMLNPVNFKVARAMLVVAYMRAGWDDDAIKERLSGFTAGDLHGVFTWVPARKTELKAVPADAAAAAVPPTSASS